MVIKVALLGDYRMAGTKRLTVTDIFRNPR